MSINIEIDYPRSAVENMRLDEAAFLARENGALTDTYLRLYSWRQPAISFGYAQTPEKLLAPGSAREQGVEIVRRITGGGLVLHQPNELTYCLVVPLPILPEGIIPSCNLISSIFISALRRIKVRARIAGKIEMLVTDYSRDFCFVRPTKYEVMVGGQKLLGSAQKRGRFYLLQHGSLPLDPYLPVFAEFLDIRQIRRYSTNIQKITGQEYRYQDIARIVAEEFRKSEVFKSC